MSWTEEEILAERERQIAEWKTFYPTRKEVPEHLLNWRPPARHNIDTHQTPTTKCYDIDKIREEVRQKSYPVRRSYSLYDPGKDWRNYTPQTGTEDSGERWTFELIAKEVKRDLDRYESGDLEADSPLTIFKNRGDFYRDLAVQIAMKYEGVRKIINELFERYDDYKTRRYL